MKYLSYGENEIIVPFLLRRGLECKEILKRSKQELVLIRQEIKRRIFGWM